MSRYLGIDLGTSNTRICRAGRGVVMRDATAAVFDSYSGDILAAGLKAKRLIGKAPAEKDVVTPLSGGVIRRYDDTYNMLSSFFYKMNMQGLFTSFSCAISIPWGITEVERNAFENVCLEAGARTVSPLIEEPMAAAIGAGFDVLKTRSDMICDIGGGNIQTAAISYKGIIKAQMSRVGGDDLDDDIISCIKSSYNVLIGKQSAEALKIKIGSAHPAYDRGTMEIRGRNLLTGQAAVLNIRSGEIREAMGETLARFAEELRSTIESCAPEVSSDIMENGVKLCGGTALLPGLSKYLEDTVGVRTACVKYPLDCVINGIDKIISGRGELAEIVSIKQ